MTLRGGALATDGRLDYTYGHHLPISREGRQHRPWRLLVVDEDPVVHEGLGYALAGAQVGGCPLELLHAYSLAEGESLLASAASRPGQQWLTIPNSELTGQPVQVYLEINDESGEHGSDLVDGLAALVMAGFRTATLLTRLRSLAHYDPLSRLPNRPLFITLLDSALNSGRDWVVAIVDIDHFSSITNTLGYRIGDALLRAVAARLKAALEVRDFRLARIGTDSFAVLAPLAEFAVGDLLSLFNPPVEVESYQLPVSVTVGVTHAKDISGGGEDVLKGASMALKLAKQQARGSYRSFVPNMAMEAEVRLRLLQDLRQALLEGVLDVHYQPQVNLSDGQPVGVEALVRWEHPTLGMIPPDRFIDVAERSGLIVELGEFVLRRACSDMVELAARGLPRLRVAVNVSMNQFRSPRFLPFVHSVLAETGLDPSLLELEITESMVMNDVHTVVTTLNAIKALGVSVALDDFGTGFSSLSYLRLLPIDRLKVDRSFVRDVDGGQSGAKIAHMIVSLGLTLGMSLIAEGIEASAEADILQDWGCQEGQGFQFARPMNRLALIRWLRVPV